MAHQLLTLLWLNKVHSAQNIKKVNVMVHK